MSALRVLITARLGSSRLPAKHLRPMRGDTPAIVCLIERLRTQPVPLVLCVPTGEEDAPLRDIATAQGIGCFAGDLDNVLVRYAEALDHDGAPAAVIVDADDAFVSVEAVAGIAAAWDDHDVITCGGLFYGGAPYLLSRRFIGAMLAADTSPNGWSRFLSALPGNKLALEDWATSPAEQAYRLSLDYEEDLAFMRHLYAHVPGRPVVRTADVVAYITTHRALLAERFPSLFDGSLDDRARRHIG
ncbi:MAG: hypothetical protein H7840_09940 [Alphaproteobacteria bacterium]